MAAVARGLLFRVLTTNAMQQDRPDPSVLTLEVDRYVKTMTVLGL